MGARKNHQALWTSCFTAWCGTDSNRTPAAEAATPWQRIGTAKAVPFQILDGANRLTYKQLTLQEIPVFTTTPTLWSQTMT